MITTTTITPISQKMLFIGPSFLSLTLRPADRAALATVHRPLWQRQAAAVVPARSRSATKNS
ncbi:hypothetical protein [Geminicoccus roseus]|uniref:hypothetical protein n=1 Tax=Geminicoccus roseus TaxID=404900 RepID=UPI0012F744FD|nr:hypothetical protein [Geminicoccus roseus]